MTDSLIENIESNATKYDSCKNKLKERFIDVCNKENELGRTYTENEIKRFNLVMNVIKSHMEFTDMSSANCMQTPLNNIQTSMQEINNFITQKVNTNLYART